jgi:AcrR family transcriptional regulator
VELRSGQEPPERSHYFVGVSERQASGTRPYRMQARAKAAAKTAERILDATDAVFDERPIDEFTLAQVAERADVTVQTILRRFGSRKALIAATLVHVGVKMGQSRGAPPQGDPGAAIDGLVDHYDRFGGRILRLLAEEERHETLQAMTDVGRAYHRGWCEEAFAEGLAGLRGADRERRVAQFVAVTDIYVWKLLRRDRKLSARQTKLAMRELLEPLLEQAT